jgi:SAM-dependent methyltransferase
LDWDYTALADAYLSRPDYAPAAIDVIARIVGLRPGMRVLDLGAGAGHLTIPLAARGVDVLALEPNPVMRAHGEARTRACGNVRWLDAVMEDTGQGPASVAVCAYGSSFGVVDRSLTLREAARVLADHGWFVCLFNHRDLEDPLQRDIEALIRSAIPAYRYGSRRDDQRTAVTASGFFEPAVTVEVPVTHVRPAADWVQAWRSHATLRRQAGDRIEEVLDGIASLLHGCASDLIAVPYVTRVCLARRHARAVAP